MFTYFRRGHTNNIFTYMQIFKWYNSNLLLKKYSHVFFFTIATKHFKLFLV